VGSLLTSRHPNALGLTRFSSLLDEDALLLSEVLKQHGYTTGAVVSHRFCSARWGFDQGFDVFDEESVQGHGAVTSPAVSDRALAFLDEHGREPFFLWLHYFDPHFDYIEHAGFGSARGAAYAGPVASGMLFDDLLDVQRSLAQADVAELRRIYDSEIAFTDHHIGRVLERLRESGWLDETVVVLTADHGEEFLEHGRLGHARTLYQEVVAVPLLLRIPGRAPGVVGTPVALLDVFPTLLDALSLPPQPGVDGGMLPQPGEAAPGRTVFTATDRRGRKRAAIEGDLKLIRHATGEQELYDLAADPGEQRDLAGAGGPALARLEASLVAFERELRGAPVRERRIELTGEEADALEALGYSERD
jgi:arylsulfatase A-like enzyme